MKSVLLIITAVLCLPLLAQANSAPASQPEKEVEASPNIPEPAPYIPIEPDLPRSAPTEPRKEEPAPNKYRFPEKNIQRVNPCMGGNAPDWCR